MRLRGSHFNWVLLVTCLLVSFQKTLQASSVSDPQAITLANEAAASLIGSATLNDATLNTTATWVLGSTNENGTAVLKLKGTESRLDLNAGTVLLTEIRNDSGGAPAGEWIGADGIAHKTTLYNSLGPTAWFSPISVLSLALRPNAALSYVGRESRDQVTVDHLLVSQCLPASIAADPALAKRLSKLDLYLAADSHLPFAICFSIHPERGFLTDISVEIRFSDYRTINGVTLPFRIERFLQGVSNLSLTVQNASINSGILDTDFTIQ